MSVAGLSEALAGGGILAALAAFAGGLISSANPCVLGTIFLLISFVGSYGHGTGADDAGGQRRLLVWSLAYAAGTIVAFTALGLVAAQAGLALGLMSKRWYLLIAAITAWMGLQTIGILPAFGWATPGPPSDAAALQRTGARRRGAWIALLLGGLAAIILSPCATPVLIAVLSLAASRGGGEAVWLLMLYGVGRAVPLVLVGVSGELVQRIMGRRGVDWWHDRGRLIVGMGILLLSLYFIYLGA